MGRPWRDKRSKYWQLVHLSRSHHRNDMILMVIYFILPPRIRRLCLRNSGVHIEALDERTSQNTTYFGVIDDIWKVRYSSNIQIPVFRCRWVKHPKGVEVDGYGFMIGDLNNIGYKDDP